MIRYRPLSTRPIWSVMRDTTTAGRVPGGLSPLAHPPVGRTGPGGPDWPGVPPSPTPAVPWTLRAAAGLVSIEALVESVAVSGRTNLTVGLRVALVLCIALKWLFAWRALRLGPGAALGLLLLEGTTVVAALGAVDTDALVRVALAGTAVTVIALLAASLHAFPTPALPKG
jgi:hypothetical protein